MPAISKKKAVEILAKAIEEAPPDELAEYYNELYPEEKTTEKAVERDPAAHMETIRAYFKAGLEMETILDLWHVVFPQHGGVSYDEETKRFKYEESRQAIWPED